MQLNPARMSLPSYAVSGVNLALRLEKPLLVTGRPGIGKSSIGYAVAENLGLPPPLVFRVRKSSTVTDLLYRFDYQRQLLDAQLRHTERKPADYLELAPLGVAIARTLLPERVSQLGLVDHPTHEAPIKSVVIVDGVDHGSADFLEDLPDVLEVESLRIKELGITLDVDRMFKPVIILTDTGEVRFSQRLTNSCVALHLPRPTFSELAAIANAQIPDLPREKLEQVMYATRELDVPISTFLDVLRAVRDLDPASQDWHVTLGILLGPWRSRMSSSASFAQIEDPPVDISKPMPLVPARMLVPLQDQPISPSCSEDGVRAFLCHSSDDKEAVRELYDRLRNDGVIPWLDEEDLIGGQDWREEIPKAVRASDVVIVCLSRSSISKEGYVQKEIKYALDVADEKPAGTIYLIPVRLEECVVPERLQAWHRVDLFTTRGYEKLLQAITIRGRSLRSR